MVAEPATFVPGSARDGRHAISGRVAEVGVLARVGARLFVTTEPRAASQLRLLGAYRRPPGEAGHHVPDDDDDQDNQSRDPKDIKPEQTEDRGVDPEKEGRG